MEEGTRLEEVGRIEKLEKFKAQSEQQMQAMAEEMAKLKERMVMSPPPHHQIIDAASTAKDASHGWQAVNSKRGKNQPQQNKKPCQIGSLADADADEDGNVFHAIKEQASKKKEKKPRVTVAEAASKIAPRDLQSFMAKTTASYGSEEDTQLLRFVEYFGLAFSGVGAAQFPWVKLFRDSTLAKIIEIPLSNVSYAVYKISVDWINQRSLDALGSFVLGLLDSIFTDLASQLASIKGSEKGAQSTSSKSQVAEFVVLAMVLQGKPEALLNVLPTLGDNVKYQGQDKLPVIVWIIAQVCQGDLPISLYAWAHNLLPLFSKASNNSRDLILQLVERILSAPKARTILMDNAVRRGLIPPSSFEILIRLTYPVSSTRIEVTERFEAVYPTLKDIALAGVPGSNQVSEQIFSIAIQVAKEGTSGAKEGIRILLWSLSQHNDCYKLWDKLYLDNLEVSVAVLRKLTEQWERLNFRQPSQQALKTTLRSFQIKNQKALDDKATPQQALFKEAGKCCELLASRVSVRHGWKYYMNVLQIIIGVLGLIVVAISVYLEFNNKLI